MPTGRIRNKDERTNVSGTCYWNIRGTSSSSRPQGNSANCVDVVGNRKGANPFTLTRNFTVQPYLNGKLIDPLTKAVLRSFTNYPIDLAVAPISTYTRFGIPSALELGSIATRTLAKTNPSQPDFGLPSFLAELKDIGELREVFANIRDRVAQARLGLRYIPTAIRLWGQQLIKAAAEGHLAYRWAIRPLVSDLLKMTQFVQAMEARMKLLRDLEENKSISRRMFVSSDSVTEPVVDTFLHSDLDIWKAKRYTTITQNTWSSVQWHTTGLSMLPKTDKERFYASIPLVLGLNGFGALAALWEIYPWSWFVDWFAGIGTAIAANNNTLFLTHTKSCVMRTSTSETTYQVSQKGTWSTISSMPYARQTRKERFVVVTAPPVDPAFLTIIDGRKWSILASLWVLDSGRRRRLFH